MSVEKSGSVEVEAVRRVVTGHDVKGKAVVVSDTQVGPTSPDFGRSGRYGLLIQHHRFLLLARILRSPDRCCQSPVVFTVMVFTLPPRFNPDELLNPNLAELAEAIKRHAESKDDTHPVVYDPNPPGTYGRIRVQGVCMRQHRCIVLCRFQANPSLFWKIAKFGCEPVTG